MPQAGRHQLAQIAPYFPPGEEQRQHPAKQDQHRLHLGAAGELALLPGFLQPSWGGLLGLFSAILGHGDLRFAIYATERGCVVLDQPQHAANSRRLRASHALRLVFDTAALRFPPAWRTKTSLTTEGSPIFLR